MSEVSKKIAGEVKISSRVSAEILKKIKNLSDLKKRAESSFKKEVTELLETILAGAISLESSDIHFEPKEEKTKVRLRIDGLLQDLLFLEKPIYQNLLSRIKLLSGIKLNITDRPQDGRFSVLVKESVIEARVSALPSEYGESIVLRLLNPKSLISIESLGLRKDLLKIFKKEIKKPNGMIVVTGPTGSGKTTSLYAFLKELQKPELKIITIEDPIEYHLKGVSQTQVNPGKGYTFASGLKSIMRQDPDVVLVGEIRDLDTASIALQAALTGHLVFTTLHTNDAAGTISRLQALGEKPVNIGPAINMAIAQRLVRKVCQKCSKPKKISPPTFKKIGAALRKLPKEIKTPKLNREIRLPRAIGCQDCNSAGYRGRIGVFEALLVDDEMENFILKTPSTAALREKAIKRGMVTMYQDGIIKVLEGITTIEEVERIVGEQK